MIAYLYFKCKVLKGVVHYSGNLDLIGVAVVLSTRFIHGDFFYTRFIQKPHMEA